MGSDYCAVRADARTLQRGGGQRSGAGGRGSRLSLTENGDGIQEASALQAGSSYTASLKLLGIFPVKDVTVSVVEPTMVAPSGHPFGIKMFTDGVWSWVCRMWTPPPVRTIRPNRQE